MGSHNGGLFFSLNSQQRHEQKTSSNHGCPIDDFRHIFALCEAAIDNQRTEYGKGRKVMQKVTQSMSFIQLQLSLA